MSKVSHDRLESAKSIILSLEQLQSDALAMLENIEWNLAALLGAAMVIERPALINGPVVPSEVLVDELSMSGSQILGLTLEGHERKNRIDEVLALGKRCLICDSTELAADVLYRAARISEGHGDPYLGDSDFSVAFQHLNIKNPGKSGSLISPEQRNFMRDCAVELRGLIRHNNARLLPKKNVVYSGTPASIPIVVNQKWVQGSGNELSINLKVGYDIFKSVRTIVMDGLNTALAKASK